MPSARQWGSIVAVSVATGACLVHRPCDGLRCTAACPREARQGASGRCECSSGNVLVLGACVSPAVADNYCGPAARNAPGGCVFRQCSEGSVLDSATGECISKSAVIAAGPGCRAGRATVVVQGRAACVPADAGCPRGTFRSGAVCARPPVCPPGTLPERSNDTQCIPVVLASDRDDRRRIDIGAWAALVLGPDGGRGTPDVCRPLAMRPDVLGVPEGGSNALHLRIALTAPDQDLTRAYARVGGEVRIDTASHPLSGEAEALVTSSVSTLVEALRGLGGEASTAIVELRVSCAVTD